MILPGQQASQSRGSRQRGDDVVMSQSGHSESSSVSAAAAPAIGNSVYEISPMPAVSLPQSAAESYPQNVANSLNAPRIVPVTAPPSRVPAKPASVSVDALPPAPANPPHPIPVSVPDVAPSRPPVPPPPPFSINSNSQTPGSPVSQKPVKKISPERLARFNPAVNSTSQTSTPSNSSSSNYSSVPSGSPSNSATSSSEISKLPKVPSSPPRSKWVSSSETVQKE